MKKIIQIINTLVVLWVYYNLAVIMINNPDKSFNVDWWILFFVTSIFFKKLAESIE